jgi:hypothetical protein
MCVCCVHFNYMYFRTSTCNKRGCLSMHICACTHTCMYSYMHAYIQLNKEEKTRRQVQTSSHYHQILAQELHLTCFMSPYKRKTRIEHIFKSSRFILVCTWALYQLLIRAYIHTYQLRHRSLLRPTSRRPTRPSSSWPSCWGWEAAQWPCAHGCFDHTIQQE